ncbi:hypothetical protein ABW20_dc0105617 [Dactylellina cionopaga]|nr:hypothetical protein ABW20_dc0105617 [Dactylellina cionopaga]
MNQLNEKVSSLVVPERTVDLPKVIKNQIYHQIVKALQSPRLRKKQHFKSTSNDVNELISQPLEKFQDLFARTGSLLLSPAGDEIGDDDENSEFEDLFEDEDNYSDFEDLLEETKGINLNRVDNKVSPHSHAVAEETSSTQHPEPSSQIPQHDYDMASDRSDSEYTMIGDTSTKITNPHYDTDFFEIDECYFDVGHPLSQSPSSSLTEKTLPTDENTQSAALWRDEESMLMMF